MPKIIVICISVWIVPLATGTIATALDKMEPVTGNWCWIAPKPMFLRYALGHAWRMGIFIIVIVLYGIIFVRVRRRLSARKRSQQQRFTVTYTKAEEVSEVEQSLRHAHDEIIMGQQTVTGDGAYEGMCNDVESNYAMKLIISKTRQTSSNGLRSCAPPSPPTPPRSPKPKH